MGRVCLELRNVRLHLPSHVLRAAPEGEHVVAVREARHGRRGAPPPSATSATASTGEAALYPVGAAAAARLGQENLRLDGKRAPRAASQAVLVGRGGVGAELFSLALALL